MIALIALLVVLLIYRSAARYDAAHEHELWTAYDERWALEHERDRNHARLR